MNLQDTIETGPARMDEIDSIVRMLCDAFAMPYEPARDIYYSDPYFDLDNKRVLRVNGRVVSYLNLTETECWIGQATVKLAGIAGMVTLPDECGKGHATRLLADTITLLRERGFPLCGLIPSVPDFYRKRGWEHAAFSYRYLTSPHHLPAYPEAQHVRTMQEKDLPRVQEMYTYYNRNRNLHCLRDAKRWRYIYDHVKMRVVADFGNGPEGYLLYEYRGTPLAVEENAPIGAEFPPTLRILEMQIATSQAIRALLGYLAAQTNMTCIETEATLGYLNSNGLMRPYAGSTPSLASVDVGHDVMLRVIDFTQLCAALAPSWHRFRGTVCLICDDEFPANERTAILAEYNNNETTSRAATPAEMLLCPDRLTGDARVWAQLAVGYMSGEDACLLGHLQASSPEVADMAGVFFTQYMPFLPLVDHF